jgi:hypothetical protein
MLGASLFYGDSIITPAMSVLSALEGLAIAAPSLEGKTMRSTMPRRPLNPLLHPAVQDLLERVESE